MSSLFPIRKWIRDFKPSDRLLLLLDKLESLYDLALTQAKDLDIEIKLKARQFNTSLGAIETNDPIVINYFVGKMYDYDDDKIAPWLGIPSSSVPDLVLACYSKLSVEKTINDKKQKFLTPWKNLKPRLVSWLTCLDSIPHTLQVPLRP